MLKENKKTLILASIITILPIFIGIWGLIMASIINIIFVIFICAKKFIIFVRFILAIII